MFSEIEARAAGHEAAILAICSHADSLAAAERAAELTGRRDWTRRPSAKARAMSLRSERRRKADALFLALAFDGTRV